MSLLFPDLHRPIQAPSKAPVEPSDETVALSVESVMNTVGRRNRILVVDDYVELATLLKVHLSRNHTVECAYTGKAGIDKLENGRFDILFLDLGLPDLDGLDVLSEVKRRWPTTQVIIMTGESNLTRLSVAQQRGALRYLVKPIEPKDIRKAIAIASEIVEHWRDAGVRTIRSSRRPKRRPD